MAPKPPGDKTVTSGPSTEQLTLSGTVTDLTSTGADRVDLIVKLDDEILVSFVPKDNFQVKDKVKVTLDVGTVKVEK